MTNKKIFKELYSSKINKEKNYNRIIYNINNHKRNNMFKLVYIPISLLVVVCIFMLLNNDLKYKVIDENNIYINNTSSVGVLDIDAKMENVNDIFIPYFEFLSNLDIPKDFDNLIMKAMYVKSDINKNNYDILNSYNFTYLNTKNERRIIISFSKDYIPIRDYYFKDKTKASIINNTEVIIIKYNYGYNVTFTYNGINFDIETNDITESELINLLVSLIK